MTLLIEPDPQQAETYSFAIGHDTRVVDALAGAQRHLDDRPDELLVVVGPECRPRPALELASALHVERPHVGLVLMRRRVDVTVLNQALRAGVREVVTPDDLSALGDACRRSLEVSRRMSGATAPARTPHPRARSSPCSPRRAAAARRRSRRTSRSPSPRAGATRCASSTSTWRSATWRSRCS